MLPDRRLALSRLFKDCLAFDADACAVERAISALARTDARELDHYFDECETQLATLLYWHVKRRGALGALGGPVTATLERRYHRNLAKNAILEHGLSGVLARFDRQGIEATVLLKGASVFSAELTRFRNAFVLSDIDLLVRPADLDRAVDVLVRDGYAPTHGQIGRTGRKACLLGPDGVTKIDLHSALFWEGSEFRQFRSGRSLAAHRSAERCTDTASQRWLPRINWHIGSSTTQSGMAAQSSRLHYSTPVLLPVPARRLLSRSHRLAAVPADAAAEAERPSALRLSPARQPGAGTSPATGL